MRVFLISTLCCVLIFFLSALASFSFWFGRVTTFYIGLSYIDVVCELNWASCRVFFDPRRLWLQLDWNAALLWSESLVDSCHVNARDHVRRLDEWEGEAGSQHECRLIVSYRCLDKGKLIAKSLCLGENSDLHILATLCKNFMILLVNFLSTSHIRFRLFILAECHFDLCPDQPQLVCILLRYCL